MAIHATSRKAPAVTATPRASRNDDRHSDDEGNVFFFPPREPTQSRRRQSNLLPTGTQKIQAAATIATAACCSPQNAVNMDYLSNYASGKPSLPARRADLLDQAFVAAHY